MIRAFSFFLKICAVLFWIFRIGVCAMATMKNEFFCIPYNMPIEIFIIFATAPFIVGIQRKSSIGAVAYFATYIVYYGTAFYDAFMEGNNIEMLSNVLGVILPIFIFCDVIFARQLYGEMEMRSSNWYFENQKYDRKFDERADRNQYKIK